MTIAIETSTGDGLLSILLFFLHFLYLGNDELSKPQSNIEIPLQTKRDSTNNNNEKPGPHGLSSEGIATAGVCSDLKRDDRSVALRSEASPPSGRETVE